ncbi:MAG: aminodeoxychorismate synthase component I [Cloacibacterium sp.]|nr:aminodeoxychorismate synthase component I [Cloacibacterium sp.]
MQKFQKSFDDMDRLSEKEIPFFFIIDFLVENILVFQKEDLEENNISVAFPHFVNHKTVRIPQKEIQWTAFPQSKNSYQKGFEHIQKNLKEGNSYLMNYTCKTEIETNLSLEEIYYLSVAKYKVLFGDRWTFFSPETFIEIIENKIFTHPMKGTIDASKPDAEQLLKQDKKEKAEHYTVVDLLRNDLSMVANEVQLDEFQRIDFIKTRNKNLLAMSSEISGTLKPEFQNKIGSIMQTLLPAGSILGAPKPKTLEVTLEAENYSRGFYTGVCGWFDGKNLDSCVMIRFVEREAEKLYFKSGGGITHMSRLEDEYQEMKNKIYVPIH